VNDWMRWFFSSMILLVCGCSPIAQNNSSTKISEGSLCVSTTGMIGNLVESVGQDAISTVTLMGPGVDPHLFKPTRDDVVVMRRAQVIFYNGIHLEGRMGTVFDHLPEAQSKLIVGQWVWDFKEQIDALKVDTYPIDALSNSREASNVYRHPDDPHIWMDVLLWSEAPMAIADSLGAIQPKNKAAFIDRAKKLRERLQALHNYGFKLIATIPAKQRILITSHDAFQYFGNRYNIEVRGVQGMSTESEAGLATITELVQMIVDRDVPSIFVESSVSSNTMRALVEGCAARGHTIQLGGPLYSDALGASGTYEGTYIGMMDHNFRTIAQCLGGSQSDERFGQ